MPPRRPRRPGDRRSDLAQDAEAFISEDSAPLVAQSTSTGPTWFLDARPLDGCHDDHADEYAIPCPEGDHDALAWRTRPGVTNSGWACPNGHRGRLWQLLPGVAR